ncbi:MAG: alpha-amylase [Gammaproteobacteria bacterium]|nr:alpha-amylase [Gammaproteobacteria bacterium]
MHKTLLVLLAAGICGCASVAVTDVAGDAGSEDRYMAQGYVQIEHPDWARNAAIYELNTRQFTTEGTFRAAMAHLPRIRDLGIDIVWLMPIHQIGEKNRKGTLGSPYSIRDYFSVNPELGTEDDLRAFVDRAHELGMYVIIDWVANHTAWDNPLVESHPHWYTKTWNGEMTHTPGTDWTDIVDLDYSNAGVRRYMTEALTYWVREFDIDGYRCDVAGFVPVAFWDNARAELDAIKPVFMLAEWESRDLHANAFDMSYGWSWYSRMHDIAMGRADVNAIRGYYFYDMANTWPDDAYRMVFVSNHDKNTWDGTQFQMFGKALEASIVLSVVGDGMPLVYSGQEAGNPKRLEFFEKDEIEWRPHPIGELYRSLLQLLEQNQALWHGNAGGQMVEVGTSSPESILSFVRAQDGDKVFAVFNFSKHPRDVLFDDGPHYGAYRDWFSGETQQFDSSTTLRMSPWSYRIFVR